MRQIKSKRLHWPVGRLPPGVLRAARGAFLRLATARLGLEIPGAVAAALNATD